MENQPDNPSSEETPNSPVLVVDEFLVMMMINAGLMDAIEIGTFAGTVETFYNTEDVQFLADAMVTTMEYLVINGYALVGVYDENGMFFEGSNPLFYNAHILKNLVLYEAPIEFEWTLLLCITDKGFREYEEYCSTHDYETRADQLYAAFDARREREKQGKNP